MKVSLIKNGKPTKEVEFTKVNVVSATMPMTFIGLLFTKAVYAFVAR